MKTEKIKQLLTKYYDGDSTLEEERTLREFFSGGDIPDELKPYAAQFNLYTDAQKQRTEISDTQLFAKLDESNPNKKATIYRLPFKNRLFQVAASVAFLIIGFAGGVWYAQQPASPNNGIASRNTKPISTVLTHFQKASASEQIKLISQVTRQPNTNEQVLHALIYTLNNDDNVNVRMAAAEALYHFKNMQPARNALIVALKRESDPNMQITLIDLLVKMREKKAVNVMQVLLLNNHLDKIVRNELEQGIGILSWYECAIP